MSDTDKPSEDEKPDDAAFERTLRNLVSTPPTPHQTPKSGARKAKPRKA